MIGLRWNLTGSLAVACVVLALWGSFATYQWVTAGAECGQEKAQDSAQAQADENDRGAKADKVATGIFANVRGATDTVAAGAAERTEVRAAQIRTVYVTGECRMPEGMPSLEPAVQEARDAAAD